MLGGLGTAHGFSVALSRAAAGGNARLFAAFSDSLQFTVWGLAVAVLLTVGRGYLANQAETITKQIHEFSARLINALIDLPDVRLGHR
jgi:biopolymer transport protein ExbB/TolQ